MAALYDAIAIKSYHHKYQLHGLLLYTGYSVPAVKAVHFLLGQQVTFSTLGYRFSHQNIYIGHHNNPNHFVQSKWFF